LLRKLKLSFVIFLVLILAVGSMRISSTFTTILASNIKEDSVKMELSLNQTIFTAFNETYKEEYYFLNIDDPGMYLFNISATLIKGSYASGNCYFYSLAEHYSPILDENVSQKTQIEYEYFSLIGEEDYEKRIKNLIFVNPGSLIIEQSWALDPEETVETELTVKKLVSLSEAVMLNFSENFFNWTEEKKGKFYKLNVSDAGGL